jgi:hypothetical protein
LSEDDLELEGLLTQARLQTGLSDFGAGDFLPGLQALLDTYGGNGFTAEAQQQLRGRLLNLLIARLNIEAAWTRHPESLALTVATPMFLTGLPRTGTSALLNVLANDPATRSLKLWEGLNPWPLENLEPGQQDPRYLGLKAYYDEANKSSAFSKVHYTTADTPEECIHLTNHTFQDAQFGFELFLEPYASYYRGADQAAVYRYHANLLRLLQWQRPGERWLLKTPAHVDRLDHLLHHHPDCRIIITHRNPLEVVGSYSSMMWALMPPRESADPGELGQRVLHHLARQMDTSMELRERIDPARILDIQYPDFVADASGVSEHIYRYFDMPYPESTRALIENHIASHPRGEHGSHDYQLDQFGLNEKQVLERFDGYIRAYDIAC